VTVAGLLAAVVLASGVPPAAVVGGQPILLAEVEARCGQPCATLTDEIRSRKWRMLETLVGEALLAGQSLPAPEPVTDAEVVAYQAAHAADFHGPPERDRAAVRFLLERERRQAVEAEAIVRQRARRPPRMEVGADAPALADRGDRVLARVGERAIRNRDVEERLALPLYRLRGALARERRRHVEALIDEGLWSAAAASRGTDPEALRAQVRSHAAPVTDADVDRYFETEVRPRSPGAEKRPDRLRPYLEFRAAQAAEDAFLAEARRGTAIRIALSEPPPPRLALGPGAGGWRGGARWPRRLVFLTSYRGATSRAMWRVVRDVAAGSHTALAVRPLLPQWDPEATAVAAAIRCAVVPGRQWEVHDAAVSADVLPDREALLRIAARLGLDPQAFAACLDRPDTLAAVAAESAAAERLGLDEPPVVLVDGRPFGGMQEAESLRDALRRGE
jgi:hypothetical protein